MGLTHGWRGRIGGLLPALLDDVLTSVLSVAHGCTPIGLMLVIVTM